MEQIVEVVGAGVIVVLVALAGWLTKKFVNWLDSKTSVMDVVKDYQKKAKIKDAIVFFAELAVRQTAQTFVDGCRERSKDGKLTSDEKKEAFAEARTAFLDMLSFEGLELGQEVGAAVLKSVIEGWVAKLAHENLVAPITDALGNS